MGLCLGAAPAKERVLAGAQGAGRDFVLLECERVESVEAPFAVAADEQASGGKCVVLPRPATGKKNLGGMASLRFRVCTPGSYRLWARVWWTDGCGNSFRLKLNGKRLPTVGQDGTYKSWHWVDLKMRTLKLAPGEHVLEILGKEDGIKIDQFFLTTNTRYIPAGIERS